MLNSNIIKAMVVDFVRSIARIEYTKITSIEISEISIKDGTNYITFVANDGKQNFYYCSCVLDEHIKELTDGNVPVYTLKSVSCLDVKSSKDRILVYVA